jgi:ABC-type nickel/cobalt efflux system permease component RcnA
MSPASREPTVRIAHCVSAALALFFVTTANAHPVPRRSHDRTVMVQLSSDPKNEGAVVRVNYRLEVDEFTALYEDLLSLSQKIDLSRLASPKEFYETYTQTYAPILAANLIAKLDDQALSFVCVQREHSLRDEKGLPLGHLRCNFVFEAHTVNTSGDGVYHFKFREGNYEFEEGLIRVSLVGDGSVRVLKKTETDDALKARPQSQWKPGDEEKLRTASAEFTFAANAPQPPQPPLPSQVAGPNVSADAFATEHSLLTLLLDSRQGFWVLLALAVGFGAIHALTPGHGKTLVAAYLVGERGTVSHALLLGLITTLTHTGAVFVLAALLLFLFPHAVPRDIQMALGLVGGLLIAGLGLWLLLRRLSGGADHFHLPGHGHHHHDHHEGRHSHDHSHVHPTPDPARPVEWWGLVMLGVSGGIVPCWDAILMLGFAISAQRLWLGIPLLLAFSAGLAGVLIIIGIGVVYVKNFASSRWSESRLVRALPFASALLVTCMGFWLCYDSTRTSAGPEQLTVQAAP